MAKKAKKESNKKEVKKSSIDIDRIKKVQNRVFELRQLSKDGLIAIIGELEKW